MSEYHIIAKNEYYEDFSGFHQFIDDLEFYIAILDEIDKLTGKLNIFEKKFRNMIIKYKILYLIWIASIQFFQNPSKANTFISYNFYFDSKRFTRRSFEKLNKIYYKQRLKDKWCQLISWIFRKESYRPNSPNGIIPIIEIVTQDKKAIEELLKHIPED
ncbi:hypothetical protein [Paenibacillus sp. sgz500958]|uniref:hypothetical protein n=1 Tax=Paenibacillus sp. sgz500958 TaxID=3242475 RepID=UPI0036D32ED2